MNASLFKSPHAIVALLICAATYAWLIMLGASMGTRAGSNVDFVIWSGWIATALMFIAMLYCARKYMHKLRYSPEFRLKVPVRSLEAADAGLNEIRRRIMRGDFNKKSEVENAAKRVLRDQGVSKVVEAHVRAGNKEEKEPKFVIETKPPEKWGRMSKWLHAHAYYGLASGLIVVFHGGFAMTHPMGIILNLLTAIVMITGIFGMYIFAKGPSWMTKHEKDLNFEENYVIDGSIRDKIRIAMDAMEKSLVGEPEMLQALAAGNKDYDRTVGFFEGWMDRKQRALQSADNYIATAKKDEGPDPALLSELSAEPVLKAELETALAANAEDPKKLGSALKKARDGYAKTCTEVQDLVTLYGQHHSVARGLNTLTRIKFVMNVWRAVHIPASLALIGMIILHILSILWY